MTLLTNIFAGITLGGCALMFLGLFLGAAANRHEEGFYASVLAAGFVMFVFGGVVSLGLRL